MQNQNHGGLSFGARALAPVDLPELSLEQGPEHHLDCIHEPEQFWLMNAI